MWRSADTIASQMPHRPSLLLAVAAVVLVAACTGPEPAHYAAILDELTIPSDWELAKTQVRGPDGDQKCDPLVNAGCPGVIRYYLVDGLPVDAYRSVQDAVIEAGFVIDREFDPLACDAPPSAPACGFFASREADRLTVNIYNRGQDDGTGVGEANHLTVRMTADR